MKIESHILSEELRCLRCGLALALDPLPRRTRFPLRIGLITGLKFSGNTFYVIKNEEHDSNQLCALQPVEDLIEPSS